MELEGNENKTKLDLGSEMEIGIVCMGSMQVCNIGLVSSRLTHIRVLGRRSH